MGLELVFFAGAAVLLAALIYAILRNRHRSREANAVAEEVTRRRYQEAEGGGVSPLDQPTPRLSEPNGAEPAFSEEDMQREQFGPRGVKGAPGPAKMTPQRAKKTSGHIDQGHVS
ncbi:MAG: hypothetical protein JOZ74_17560 [Bradyrhizobium sp.]|nr:hypothetical protein [Bradyrhizobium sp.]